MDRWGRATLREVLIVEDIFGRLRRAGAIIPEYDDPTTVQTLDLADRVAANGALWARLPRFIGPDSKDRVRAWLREELNSVR